MCIAEAGSSYKDNKRSTMIAKQEKKRRKWINK